MCFSKSYYDANLNIACQFTEHLNISSSY